MCVRSVAWFALVVAALLLPSIWGCGPSVAKEDLGTVVTELPDIPGAKEPFEMPELGPPPPPDPELEGF